MRIWSPSRSVLWCFLVFVVAMLVSSSAWSATIASFDVFRDNRFAMPPGGKIILTLGINPPDANDNLSQSIATMRSREIGQDDLSVPVWFDDAEVAAFVAVLLDATDQRVVNRALVPGNGFAYYESNFVFTALGGTSTVAESLAFGAPTLANLLARSTIGHASFTLTQWGGGGQDWGGRFDFVTAIPEPSTALLMLLGLAGLGSRRRQA